MSANENHFELASRLIAKHSNTWHNCDEYSLTHVVAHLVAAIGATDENSSRDEAVELMVTLFENSEFGVSRAVRSGVDAMINDYVAAYEVLREAASARVTSLAVGLAEVLARLGAQDTPHLAGTVQATLSYRPDLDELNQEILRRLSNPEYLELFITDESVRSFMLTAFTHNRATRLRRQGDLTSIEEARSLLHHTVSLQQEFSTAAITRQYSSLYYELGYFDFLQGNHEQARDWFESSREAAEQSGDRAAAYISQLIGLRVGLLSGVVEPEDYRAALEEALTYFSDDKNQGPHSARWTMNIQGQLLDLALLVEDHEQAIAKLELLGNDSWLQKTRRSDIVRRYQARVATMSGNSAEGCELFDNLLREELTEPPSHREELARDLLYYGQALAATGNLTQAHQVWELGARCPDNAANWPWKAKIAAMLPG